MTLKVFAFFYAKIPSFTVTYKMRSLRMPETGFGLSFCTDIYFLISQEIVAISQQRRITSPGSPILTPTPSTSYGIDNLGPPTPRFSKLGTMLSSASLTRGATAVSGLTDESVIGDIFGHYCSMVFDGVLTSIVSSLMVFGDCVKPLGRLTSGIQVSQGSR